MKLRLSLILAAVAVLTVLFSCKKESAVDTTATLSAGTSYVSVDGGSVFLTVNAKGQWTLSIEPQVSWATVSPSSGSGDRGDVRLRFDANPDAVKRSVKLVLLSGGTAVNSLTVTQYGTEDSPTTGKYGYDVAPMDWLELPATVAGDGRELLVHDKSGGPYASKSSSGVRNWSCYWDYDDHLSLWVAYPLSKALIGSGSRTNQWGYDKLLPASIQPALISNSYGGGWTRGHQIPSADRLTYAANVSTFVPTNMTPQDYDFNCGIWADLEGKVRSYANQADTLYVVTGCLFDKSTKLTGKDSGFYIKVPTHYFKALLYKGSSTYATSGYMAAGFYLEHSSSISGNSPLDYLMPIDELEKKTGIDFFPNLSAKVGDSVAAKIEAETPSKWWK